jgi:hypothetical protein
MQLDPYLNSELPWVRWAAMAWIQRRPADDPECAVAHAEVMAHPLVQAQLAVVLEQPWLPMKNHRQAAHPIHRLALLVDLGLTVRDPQGHAIAQRLLAQQAPAGPLQLIAQIPKAFGGSGLPELQWAACDAPLLSACLATMGLADDPALQRAAQHLVGLVRPSGWPCSTSPGFRGPGRKADPCPYANLLALRALSRIPGLSGAPAAAHGIEVLLGHWQRRSQRKLYLFGVGTDYAKPKYPLVWYDLLHVLEVLSRFAAARADARFLELLALLEAQADPAGRYKPTTVWMAYKGFDFAQKRAPSPTLELAFARIIGRVRAGG